MLVCGGPERVLRLMESYVYEASAWGSCAPVSPAGRKCDGSAVRRREVHCTDAQAGRRVEESFCAGLDKPRAVEECPTLGCDGAEYGGAGESGGAPATVSRVEAEQALFSVCAIIIVAFAATCIFLRRLSSRYRVSSPSPELGVEFDDLKRITAVAKDSPLRGHVNVGDTIKAVNGSDVQSAGDLESKMELLAEAAQPVTLDIEKDAATNPAKGKASCAARAVRVRPVSAVDGDAAPQNNELQTSQEEDAQRQPQVREPGSHLERRSQAQPLDPAFVRRTVLTPRTEMRDAFQMSEDDLEDFTVTNNAVRLNAGWAPRDTRGLARREHPPMDQSDSDVLERISSGSFETFEPHPPRHVRRSMRPEGVPNQRIANINIASRAMDDGAHDSPFAPSTPRRENDELSPTEGA